MDKRRMNETLTIEEIYRDIIVGNYSLNKFNIEDIHAMLYNLSEENGRLLLSYYDDVDYYSFTQPSKEIFLYEVYKKVSFVANIQEMSSQNNPPIFTKNDDGITEEQLNQYEDFELDEEIERIFGEWGKEKDFI